MPRFLCFWCLLLTALMGAGPALASKVALVIGNASYQSVTSLKNPVNDADLAARTFTALGFDTEAVLDAGSEEMQRALSAFKTRSENAEVALIFFAGHGVQADNVNYLLPTDTKALTQADFETSAVNMTAFLDAFAETSKVRLLVVDACRDNPFSQTRALLPVQQGLARVNHQLDDLVVVYSAQPNQRALDGDGPHSPFMQALAEVLTSQAQVKLSDALIDITNFVRTQTASEQLPYIEGTLSVHLELKLVAPPQTSAAGTQQLCGPETEVITLKSGGSQALTLRPGTQSLVMADEGEPSVTLCIADGVLHVDGRYDKNFTGQDARNAEHEGAGYYFKTSSGEQAHLWFYIDPANAAAKLEVGVYLDDTEISWIETGWEL